VRCASHYEEFSEELIERTTTAVVRSSTGKRYPASPSRRAAEVKISEIAK
jgi:hypothetical protein